MKQRRPFLTFTLALLFCLSLAACGTAEQEPAPEPTPSLPAGSYSFSESAMGGAFTVENLKRTVKTYIPAEFLPDWLQ